MSPDDGGVQHDPFQVRLSGHRLEQPVQDTLLQPAVVALLRPLEGAEPFRKIPPTTARPRHPKKRIDKQSPVATRAILALPSAGHERLDPLPLVVPKNLAFQSRLQKAALNQHSKTQGILNRPYDLEAAVTPRPSAGVPASDLFITLGAARIAGR